MVYLFKTSLVLPVLFSSLVAVHGHPGEEHEIWSPAEISARQLSANVRHVQARSCAPAMAAMAAARKRKRALAQIKRQEASGSATLTASTLAPSASAITNYTCITAPEVTEGPYYIRNEFVRQDIRDGQPGLPLQIEIGVMDTTTCTPLVGAFVELWHANSTGFYGGFTSASLGGNTGGGGGGSTAMSDAETFLRGGWPTNDAGIVEVISVYPGFYSGRTAHIHMMVHTNYTISSNGTIVSDSGNLLHIGQLFFEESLNDQVFATTVYSANTNSRTLNSEDRIFAQESADGNTAFVDTTFLGATIEDGIYGYITVGVNASAHYSIATTNYNTGPVLVAAAAATASASAQDASVSVSASGAARARGLPSIFGW